MRRMRGIFGRKRKDSLNTNDEESNENANNTMTTNTNNDNNNSNSNNNNAKDLSKVKDKNRDRCRDELDSAVSLGTKSNHRKVTVKDRPKSSNNNDTNNNYLNNDDDLCEMNNSVFNNGSNNNNNNNNNDTEEEEKEKQELKNQQEDEFTSSLSSTKETSGSHASGATTASTLQSNNINNNINNNNNNNDASSKGINTTKSETLKENHNNQEKETETNEISNNINNNHKNNNNDDDDKIHSNDPTAEKQIAQEDGEESPHENKQHLFTGSGEFVLENGTIVSGQFVDGKKHGMITYLFPDGSSASGHYGYNKPYCVHSSEKALKQKSVLDFESSVPKELEMYYKWTISYSNGDVYWGFASIGSDGYVSSVHDVQRSHLGEMFFAETGAKYYGYWQQDMKWGYGIEVYPDGRRYYGRWKRSLYQGDGVMVYSDNSIFSGTFFHGSRNGRGAMYFSSGDILEGQWKGHHVSKAILTRNGWTGDSIATLQEEKDAIISGCRENPPSPIPTLSKWKLLFETNTFKSRENEIREGLDRNDFEKSLSQVLDKHHYLFSFFITCFAIFYNNSQHPAKDCQLAVDDIHSFVLALQQKLIELWSSQKLSLSEQRRLYCCLMDTIVSQTHSSLFPLYEGKNAEDNFLIGHRLKTLRIVSLDNLGISKDLQPPRTKSSIRSPDFNPSYYYTEEPYKEAVEAFQKIKDLSTPTEKCFLLLEVRQKLDSSLARYQDLNGSSNVPRETIELLPIWVYIIIKASVTSIKTQLDFIEDFKTDNADDAGGVLRHLAGIPEYIKEIHLNVRDEEDKLVSESDILGCIKWAVANEIERSQKSKTNRPSFMLIPSILLHIGLKIGQTDQHNLKSLTLPSDQFTIPEPLERNIDIINSILEKVKIGFRIEVVRDNTSSTSTGRKAQLVVLFAQKHPAEFYWRLSNSIEKYLVLEMSNT